MNNWWNVTVLSCIVYKHTFQALLDIFSSTYSKAKIVHFTIFDMFHDFSKLPFYISVLCTVLQSYDTMRFGLLVKALITTCKELYVSIYLLEGISKIVKLLFFCLKREK